MGFKDWFKNAGDKKNTQPEKGADASTPGGRPAILTQIEDVIQKLELTEEIRDQLYQKVTVYEADLEETAAFIKTNKAAIAGFYSSLAAAIEAKDDAAVTATLAAMKDKQRAIVLSIPVRTQDGYKHFSDLIASHAITAEIVLPDVGAVIPEKKEDILLAPRKDYDALYTKLASDIHIAEDEIRHVSDDRFLFVGNFMNWMEATMAPELAKAESDALQSIIESLPALHKNPLYLGPLLDIEYKNQKGRLLGSMNDFAVDYHAFKSAFDKGDAVSALKTISEVFETTYFGELADQAAKTAGEKSAPLWALNAFKTQAEKATVFHTLVDLGISPFQNGVYDTPTLKGVANQCLSGDPLPASVLAHMLASAKTLKGSARDLMKECNIIRDTAPSLIADEHGKNVFHAALLALTDKSSSSEADAAWTIVNNVKSGTLAEIGSDTKTLNTVFPLMWLLNPDMLLTDDVLKMAGVADEKRFNLVTDAITAGIPLALKDDNGRALTGFEALKKFTTDYVCTHEIPDALNALETAVASYLDTYGPDLYKGKLYLLLTGILENTKDKPEHRLAVTSALLAPLSSDMERIGVLDSVAQDAAGTEAEEFYGKIASNWRGKYLRYKDTALINPAKIVNAWYDGSIIHYITPDSQQSALGLTLAGPDAVRMMQEIGSRGGFIALESELLRPTEIDAFSFERTDKGRSQLVFTVGDKKHGIELDRTPPAEAVKILTDNGSFLSVGDKFFNPDKIIFASLKENLIVMAGRNYQMDATRDFGADVSDDAEATAVFRTLAARKDIVTSKSEVLNTNLISYASLDGKNSEICFIAGSQIFAQESTENPFPGFKVLDKEMIKVAQGLEKNFFGVLKGASYKGIYDGYLKLEQIDELYYNPEISALVFTSHGKPSEITLDRDRARELFELLERMPNFICGKNQAINLDRAAYVGHSATRKQISAALAGQIIDMTVTKDVTDFLPRRVEKVGGFAIFACGDGMQDILAVKMDNIAALELLNGGKTQAAEFASGTRKNTIAGVGFYELAAVENSGLDCDSAQITNLRMVLPHVPATLPKTQAAVTLIKDYQENPLTADAVFALIAKQSTRAPDTDMQAEIKKAFYEDARCLGFEQELKDLKAAVTAAVDAGQERPQGFIPLPVAKVAQYIAEKAGAKGLPEPEGSLKILGFKN